VNNIQQNIVIQAKELFMRYGFKAVTVDEIARECGISKKTLYEHFTDKDTLVNEVLALIDSSIECGETELNKSSTNAIEEVVGMMHMFETLFQRMNPNCIPDLQKYYPGCFIQWRNQHAEHESRIKRNLKRGIKEGYYRKNIDVDILAFMRVQEIMNALLNPAYSRIPFYQLQQTMMETFLYGISTLKGHELIEQQIAKIKKAKR
jgi:TetR/AcrR family transcriptional regulator, cholesterol catabolism regulator